MKGADVHLRSLLKGTIVLALMIPAAVPGAAPEPGFPSREMLSAHNDVRSEFRIRALEWSDKLARVAQDWADTLLARGRFFHRPKGLYGENLFEVVYGRASPKEVVESWASERSDYDYRSNLCHGVCGHFTQIVWRSTRLVGCAVARNATREIWVCNYDPPGNVIGQRPYGPDPSVREIGVKPED